jgi:hypothetical protein
MKPWVQPPEYTHKEKERKREREREREMYLGVHD